MNKKILVIVCVVVLFILLGGAYLMKGKSSPVAMVSDQQTTKTITEESTTVSNQKSLKDLLLGGMAQKCTYTDKLDSIDMSGTTYVANGKMRTDYTSVVENTTIKGHMIIDGDTSYTWMEGQPSGFMMKMDLNKTAPTSKPGQPKQGMDVNKVIDYKCSAWSVDSLIFTPPSDVKFTDYSAMMNPKTSGSPLGCSTCAALSGEQKTQCMTMLKCN